MAGVDISFTLTSKSAGEDEEDIYADLSLVMWSALFMPPITRGRSNMVAIAVGFSRTVYATSPEWSKLLGGVFFALWVLMHLYPFFKGLMGKGGKTPTIVFVWAGLLSVIISLLWVYISPSNADAAGTGGFTFP
jgi:hypothetical protein